MSKTPKNVKTVGVQTSAHTKHTTQKVKVGLYLTPDMIDFIDKKIAAGDAYNYTSFVFCCVKKHILAEIQSKQEI